MSDVTMVHFLWALALGAVSAVSLPLGSLVGLNVRLHHRYISMFAAFGAGALIAALSVELVAPTALALTESGHGGGAGHELAHFLALIVGGALGGLLFVALDALVNSSGGHVRKTSTTLAHLAKRRREEAQKVMGAVLKVRPFDELPAEMAEVLAGMLRPVSFKEGAVLASADARPEHAYILLEGEVDVSAGGRQAEAAGPGTLVGLLPLLVPDVASVGAITARTEIKALALSLEDTGHLRALSPAFDRACRDLAGERMNRLDEHLTTLMTEAAQWVRSASGALRLGAEVPALAIRRARDEKQGSVLAVWLGILLDGIPESLVIGAGLFVMLISHPAAETLRFANVIPYTLVAGLFLSNFPEALSSSANMLAAGWSRRRIFLMWFALMVTTSVGAGFGFLLAGVLDETWLVFAEGLAAGAMLTMIAAAMIPEAAAHGKPSAIGLSTLAGFLAAILFKLVE